MTWLPSRSGRPIELLAPLACEVDFAEIAWSLAHTNRYGGHGETPVSVALHTLIGFDLCPEPLRPWWLLHDAHESRLGDITTPALQALAAIGDQIIHDEQGSALREVVDEFKRRHDVVIHAAAGLPMPSTAQTLAIRDIDMRCLATEHRDFHRPSSREWAHEKLGIAPGRNIRRWQAPDKVADQLADRFARYLPALRNAA